MSSKFSKGTVIVIVSSKHAGKQRMSYFVADSMEMDSPMMTAMFETSFSFNKLCPEHALSRDKVKEAMFFRRRYPNSDDRLANVRI